MRCAVCGRDEGKRRETVGGDFFGNACDGECVGLLWESHFVRACQGTEADHSLMLWKMKRRRAEVTGLPFSEPMPDDSLDKAFQRLLLERPDIAALWAELRA